MYKVVLTGGHHNSALAVMDWLKKYNLKFFWIGQKEVSPGVSYPEYTEVKDFTNAEIKIIESEFLTIGDHSEIEVSKGSENLYFDFSCYIEDDEKKFYSQIKISIFTKENHDFLKEVIKLFINQI